MCVTSAVKSFESFEYFDSSFDTVVASRDPGWLNWKLIYCGCSRDRDDSKQGWLIANVNSSGGIADEDHHHHQVRERGTAAVTGVAHTGVGSLLFQQQLLVSLQGAFVDTSTQRLSKSLCCILLLGWPWCATLMGNKLTFLWKKK